MSRLDNEAVSDGDEYGVGMNVYGVRRSVQPQLYVWDPQAHMWRITTEYCGL